MSTGRWIADVAPVAEPPQAGRWIARPRKPRWALQVGAAIGLLGQTPNFLRIMLKPWLGEAAAWIATGLVTLLGFSTIGVLALRERRARRMRAADHALMDASFGDQFPVEVTIVAAGKRLGSDRGVVWFADGLMGFSGSAASFVLAAWDVEVRPKATPARGGRSAMPAGSLGLVSAPVSSCLIVQPLEGHAQAFRERFGGFQYETASPDAERFWPPLAPYSEALPAWQSEGTERGRG